MAIEIQEMYVAPQGEGPNLGRLSLFVRCHRCNLQCSWCDTKFTWDSMHPDFGDFRTYADGDVTVVLDMILACANQLSSPPTGLVLTGGEPLLYQRAWPWVIDEYRKAVAHKVSVLVEVETAGTIAPTDEMILRCHFNVSHKLPSSQNRMRREKLWNERALMGFAQTSFALKPVIGVDDEEALGEYIEWIDGTLGREARRHVYLMPEGRTRDEVLFQQHRVNELAMQYETNVTTRLHVLAYGDERRR